MLKFLIPLLLVFFACKEKTIDEAPQSVIAAELAGQKIILKDFISARPAQYLSSQSSLEFEFDRNMVSQDVVGRELSADFVEITPNMEAKAKWLSASLLQISPSSPLKSDQKYKAKLKGKRAFGKSVDVDDYDFEFSVIPNEILEVNGTFEPAAGKVNTAKLVLELRFAEKVDSAKLIKDLQLKLDSKKLSYKISFGGTGNFARIESEETPRANKAQNAEIILSENWTANNKEFSAVFLLPAKGDFAPVGNYAVDGGKQEKAWEVVFSDPIANRDVSGFVSIEPNVNYKVSVRNNTLKIAGNFTIGTTYKLRIERGLPSVYGTKTSSDFVKMFSFDNEKPELKLLGDGLFLPLENKGKMQIKSMNIGSVKLNIQEILPQNLTFFLQNNDLRSSNRWISDIERVSRSVYSNTVKLEKAKKNEWLKTEIDISNYFAKKAGAAYIVKFYFDQQNLLAPCKNRNEDYSENDLVYDDDSWSDNPCNEYYYYYGKNVSSEKILIASSIALTAKQAKDGVHVWASDVENSKPVSGLKLELYGTINDVLAEQKTNSNGYAFFPVKKDETPYIVKGLNERGLALLKLSQNNWETSRFDVGGVREQNEVARLFSYTERGVHRPGDTVHFAGIVREGIGKPLSNLAMSVTVKNPMGSVVFESAATTSQHGQFALDIPTALDAPTGNWTAVIKSGGNEWRHNLQIETVKPNRLKNNLEIPEKFIGENFNITGTFISKYLFGSPAANLNAEINYTLRNRSLKFPRYGDFTFRNPMQRFEGDEESLYNGNLDGGGEAKISKNINLKGRNIPEALSLNIKAVVHEPGGGFTESRHSGVIYPYPVFVGLKNRDSWVGVRKGDTLRIPVVALDESGKPVAGRRLSVKVYQNTRYSWWEGDSYDRWDFRTQKQTYVVHEETVQSASLPKEFKWVPENYGQIFVEIKDVEGGHSAAQFVYASYWGDPENIRDIPEASHLNLTSKSTNHSIGDSIIISFDAPSKGNAIVSLEHSNKIIESRLVEASAGKNTVSFTADKNMLPNVYAVVSLFLPLKSVEGEKPMRYYGVLPVKIEDEKTKLSLNLTAPKDVEPGEEFTVEVENKSKESASFTLAVVDEGLLDLTDFKTPDPWKFYFQKLALGVKTSDNFDEIMGALMPDMDSYLSIGGDEEISGRAGEQKTQRFKAVSLFSGVKEVKAGGREKIKFKMPQYIGSVRVQLIGVSNGAFAKRDTTITVKKPLMILPTVPRATKPGDKFKIPVSVFAMSDDIKNVKVSLQVSKELEIKGKSNLTFSFEKQGEQDGGFEVETMPILGAAKVIVTAEGGRHKIADTVDLPVLSSSALYTEVSQGQVSADETWNASIDVFGINDTHRATLVLSTMPNLRLAERLDYLIRYPYGCLEQTVSSVFPQLYIDKFTDADSKKKQEITDNINSGINRLASFSLGSGFSYWPNQANAYADFWSSSYAGHFMLEAKKAGYSVPKNLLDSWKKWEIEESKKSGKNFRNQAYRLFLLSMAGEEQAGAMNLMKENYLGELDWLSKYLLAGAYHLAGKESAAKQVLEHRGSALSDYREDSGSYGSTLRDRALAALILTTMKRQKDANDVYLELAREWNARGWWSTQESAFMLLAFAAISDKLSGGDVEAQWSVNDRSPQKVTVRANRPSQIDLSAFGSAAVSVSSLNGILFTELQTRGLPLEDRVKTGGKGISLQRTLYNRNGKEISKSQIKQGDPFWLVFRIKSLAATRLENLALSSVLPSGFEISNERLNDYDPPSWLAEGRSYTDEDEKYPNRGLSVPDYMDIRDDRVNWFFGLKPNETKIFAVQIHPSYEGVFWWPGVVLEAMYNPDYFARISGERVKVE